MAARGAARPGAGDPGVRDERKGERCERRTSGAWGCARHNEAWSRRSKMSADRERDELRRANRATKKTDEPECERTGHPTPSERARASDAPRGDVGCATVSPRR